MAIEESMATIQVPGLGCRNSYTTSLSLSLFIYIFQYIAFQFVSKKNKTPMDSEKGLTFKVPLLGGFQVHSCVGELLTLHHSRNRRLVESLFVRL